jgi:uncharacterized protein (DUF58 family)
VALLIVLVGRGAAWSTEAGWIVFGLVAFAFVLDGVLASVRPQLTLQRHTPPQLHVDEPHTIEWGIENRSPFAVRLRLRDQWPRGSHGEPRELEGTVAPRSRLVLAYQLVATRRGDGTFGNLVYRVQGPLGLAWSQKEWPAAAPIRVLPQLANWKTAELAVRQALVRQAGSHRYRWRGAGTQFESLREYSPEDDIRWVEWKATARAGRPISRNYEVERHQQVMLLVDAGRMMTTYCGRRTKFDAVLEAAVLAARAVVDQGDSLGMVVFSDRVDTYLHPRRDRTQVRAVMNALYDRHPRLVESDYESALTFTAVRTQRRSLVILFTDVTVIEAAQRMLLYLRRLAPRHLPLVVTIADETVEELEVKEPQSADDLYRVAVANQLMLDRAQLLRQLRSAGAEVLDTHADRIATQTIERYFELKRRLRL